MLEEHYPFVAQPLPYEYDALLPVLDEETLHFHHDTHSCDRVVSILHFFGRIYNFFLWYVHYINTLDFLVKA